mgnify:CR=1 FL=1
MKPITAVVKEKGGAVTYPSNQEVVTRGNKRIVKEKYTDESGRKRKLKTKYKGYSGTFVAQPDVVVSKTFTAKGGGGGRQKEEIKKRQ